MGQVRAGRPVGAGSEIRDWRGQPAARAPLHAGQSQDVQHAFSSQRVASAGMLDYGS